jgi:hypothetical protein
MICRLGEQEDRLGRVAFKNEMWVERNHQSIKERVWHQSPEITFTNAVIMRLALNKMVSEHPELGAQMVTADSLEAPERLEGKGRPPSDDQQCIIDKLWKPDSLVPAPCQKESASCTVYAKGLIHWCERITSTLYTRERNRTSYFVKIRFIDGDGNAKEFAAVVRFFFKVNQMDAPGRQAAFAVLDVFKTDIIVDKDTGNLLRAREYTGHPEKTYWRQNVVVELSSIDTKLVTFRRATAADNPGWFYYFSTSSHTSILN